MSKNILTIALIFISVNLFGQVGIGTDSPKATLEVKHIPGTTSSGILIPRLTFTEAKALQNVEHSTLIYITDFNQAEVEGTVQLVDKPGYYYFTKNLDEIPDNQGENSRNSLEGLWHNVPNREEILDEVRRITDLTANPKFFYMPSVALPVTDNDPRVVGNNQDYKLLGTGETKRFQVDLYNIFKNQFEIPVASSLDEVVGDGTNNETQIVRSTQVLQGLVKAKTDYDYVVTFADSNIFSDIRVDANGILTYKVDQTKIIRNGSFMNIVLKVK